MKNKKTRHAILCCITAALTLSLCSCAAQAQTENSGENAPDNPIMNAAWSPDSDCAPCHENENASLSDIGCIAGFHASNNNADCITCHTDEQALSQLHENANGPSKAKKLKKTEVPESICLSCHSSDSLAESTASSTVLTDSNGTTVNPHAIPEGKGHADITCINCHGGHKKSEAEDAASYCLSCHHEGVYECSTCHK